MKVKKLLLIALGGIVGLTSFAQGTKKADKKAVKQERINARVKLEEENEPAFKKQFAFGLKVNTDGYGISFEKGIYKTIKKTTLYQFEFNEKFHPKEEKEISSVDQLGNASHVKFGKANNFYQFKLGYGQQYLIGGKANKNGVAVSAIYSGGLSLGIIKPYYVDIYDNNTNEQLKYKFTDTLPAGSDYSIIGASGFTTGWSEVKFKPGVHAKAALRFDYGRFKETITAIETGINLEYYTSDILQMSLLDNATSPTTFTTKQNKLFFNAYISIQLGKRK